MQTQVLKTADGFKAEVTLRSIVRAPFYKHGKEDGNILKYLAATADGSYFAFFIDLKEDEEILELILLAEKATELFLSSNRAKKNVATSKTSSTKRRTGNNCSEADFSSAPHLP